MANDETFIGGVPISKVTGNEGPSGDEINIKGSQLKIENTAVTTDAADLNILDGAADAGLVAADLAEVAGAAANGLVAADLTKLAGVSASAAELNRTTNLGKVPLSFFIAGNLGNTAGLNTRGLLIGQDATENTADVTQEDNSAASFVDETADAVDNGSGDVEIPDPFDTNDALYVGHTSRFDCLLIDVATAGVGDDVSGETGWEYWNGSAWTSLTVADYSAGFTTGASSYYMLFAVPSDWAATTVDGGSSLYYIRFIASADDVYNTTQPIIDRLVPYPITSTIGGLHCPATGTITQVSTHATTTSGTNNDSVFNLNNVTQGTAASFTWTKGA